MKAPLTLHEPTIQNIITMASTLSTRGPPGLDAWAHAFLRAHQRVPFGLSVEVGSHIGGSAWLFGALLEATYGEDEAPGLWSVDPYGGKPYVGGHGDAPEAQPPIYSDAEYKAMKHNLRGGAYHAHWLMPSAEFFARMEGLPYWRPGRETIGALNSESGAPVELRVGVRHTAGKNSCAFILLDGEHSADSIMKDFEGAFRWLHPDGVLVIDNIDTDPYTLGRLRERLDGALSRWKLELGPTDKPEWAVIST